MGQNGISERPVTLWRNRDYLLLWLGQAISSLGTGISQFAFPLLVLALTHSFAAAGFAGALGQLPYLLFSLPAGALVDRWDRKRVMIVCTLGLALCIASIPVAILSGHLTHIQLYIVSFLGAFYAAATARYPRGFRDLSAYCLRFQAQTYGYLFLLTDRYPTLANPPR